MVSRQEYKEYCDKYKNVWKYFSQNKEKGSQIDICEKRGYDKELMMPFLSELGIFKLSDDFDVTVLNNDEFKDLGLFKKDEFLLKGRYLIPVKDMLGNIVALIGWYPDEKRYITTPSKFFKKPGMFFGMEQLKTTGLGKKYFIVEGIFDSLSLRALGFNAVAMMGINTSRVKTAMYGLFGRLVAVPDNDKQGRKVISTDSWKLPRRSSYFNWKVEGMNSSLNVKDIDDFCKMFDADELREFLSEVLNRSSERVITYVI